ncbi:SMP-30/gluconolactonase/LRE family protein [Ruegeria sp.]|uniref:SMP-30/gluconolactonase/LRE family protein n=1 Tax=Ruegeria sp. TaxID=1879320 RepID=UPI003C7B780B
MDRDHLLIASETGVSSFNLVSRSEETPCDIEAGDPLTRSNDGRAEAWGGFWAGTMSKSGGAGMGTLNRWRPDHYGGGGLRVLKRKMSTPNSICFDHSRDCAYFRTLKPTLSDASRLTPKPAGQWARRRCSSICALRMTILNANWTVPWWMQQDTCGAPNGV